MTYTAPTGWTDGGEWWGAGYLSEQLSQADATTEFLRIADALLATGSHIDDLVVAVIEDRDDGLDYGTLVRAFAGYTGAGGPGDAGWVTSIGGTGRAAVVTYMGLTQSAEHFRVRVSDFGQDNADEWIEPKQEIIDALARLVAGGEFTDPAIARKAKAKKLRHVGFSTKAAELLTKPAPTSSAVQDGLSMTCTGVPHGVKEVQYIRPDGSLISAAAPGSEWETSSFTATFSDYLSEVVDGAAYNGAAYPAGWHQWSAGYGEFSAAVWATPVVMTFRDLLRAGFSPRQARTWLRVKAMETPTLRALIHGGFDRHQASLLMELL